MHCIFNKYGYLALLFYMSSFSIYSLAITIKVFKQSTEYNFDGANIDVYPVQVGNNSVHLSLPHSIPENALVEDGHRGDEVRFVIVDHEEGGGEVRNEVTLSQNVQERLFQLLANNPDTYITDHSFLDRMNLGTGLTFRELGETEFVPTCSQLYMYLYTGIHHLGGFDFKGLFSSGIARHDIHKNVKPGYWISLKRGQETIHVMLYLGEGVYMSKIGQYGIHFHSLNSALEYYGDDLTIHETTCTASNKSSLKKPDRDPPPPGAGVCGGASLQSAY